MMRTLISTTITTLLAGAIVPTGAYAGCADFALSPNQSEYLAAQALEIQEPEGEFGDFAITLKCDVNDDSAIDINDIRAISGKRNQLATSNTDPSDWNEDGRIDALDARGCVQACTLPRCAVPAPQQIPAPAVVTGSSEGEECFQVEDLDGDSNPDFAGLYEYTGDQPRSSDWNLDLVFLYTDEGGQTRHVVFPSAGRSSAEKGEVYDTLKVQPPGVVDLMPGSVTLDRPGIVSYRNGEPAVLYYWQNGRYTQRIFSIDD